MHAVDAAGVHPLLLAIGSERYMPYAQRRRPQELLTQANALLGQGQMSLAKYLLIVAGDDDPRAGYPRRAAISSATCWRASIGGAICIFKPAPRSTRSIIRGGGLNEGSKLVIAAAGPAVRTLPVTNCQPNCCEWVSPADGRFEGHPGGAGAGVAWGPSGLSSGLCSAGRSKWDCPKIFRNQRKWPDLAIHRFCAAFSCHNAIGRFPLVVIVDEAEFAAEAFGQFPLGDFHAEQSGNGRVRDRVLHAGQALGLSRLRGDRCAAEAAPRAAAGRRRGGNGASMPWLSAAARCTG